LLNIKTAAKLTQQIYRSDFSAVTVAFVEPTSALRMMSPRRAEVSSAKAVAVETSMNFVSFFTVVLIYFN